MLSIVTKLLFGEIAKYQDNVVLFQNIQQSKIYLFYSEKHDIQISQMNKLYIMYINLFDIPIYIHNIMI